MREPLDGVRVLDLTRLFPFAVGTQMLADLGAEVIKVEPPGGEPGRAMPGLFQASNNGKRSVTIDFRDPAGPSQLLSLCRDADVVVESFRPGTLARLGASTDAMRRAKPSLVTCSITAYGPEGPRSDLPGHDLNLYGLSGAAQPRVEDPPIFPAVPVVDMAVAFFMPYCVLAALMRARETGLGEQVDIAMTDVAFAMNASSYLPALLADDNLVGLPWPAFILNETPGYSAYQGSDGRWLTVANLEPPFWHAFLEVIGRQDLAEHHLSTGAQSHAVRAEIAGVIATRPRDVWVEALSRAGTCVAPVLTPVEAGSEPQNDMTFEAGGWTRVAFPARFESMSGRGSRDAAPAVGADNSLIDGDGGALLPPLT
jgi:crotonobetainyl-CoA:carnitine CoA-transferase CaiB-like acyl-CoA transferase